MVSLFRPVLVKKVNLEGTVASVFRKSNAGRHRFHVFFHTIFMRSHKNGVKKYYTALPNFNTRFQLRFFSAVGSPASTTRSGLARKIDE